MKVLIDYDDKLSRIEKKTTAKSLLFLENELFSHTQLNNKGYLGNIKKNYKGDFNRDILHKIKTIEIATLQDAYKQFEEIKSVVLDTKDKTVFKNLDPMYSKEFNSTTLQKERLYLQKVTYEIEDEENKEEIIKIIENQSDGSFFKAVVDNGYNTISLYTSTLGIWEYDQYVLQEKESPYEDIVLERKLQWRSRLLEANVEEKIRANFWNRKMMTPEVELDRTNLYKMNFPIYNTIKNLYLNNQIKSCSKMYQNEKLEWTEEKTKYFKRPIYVGVKDTLTEKDFEEERKIQIAIQANVDNNSHKNEKTPTNEGIKKTSEENKKNLNSIYPDKENLQDLRQEEKLVDKDNIIDSFNAKIKEKLIDVEKKSVKDFYEKLENDMDKEYTQKIQDLHKEKEQKELELKDNIIKSEQILKNKKNELYSALKNGNNILQAIESVSVKISDVAVQRLMESLKNDILLSHSKEELINDISKVIVNLEKDLLTKEKKIMERGEILEELNQRISDLKSNEIEFIKRLEEYAKSSKVSEEITTKLSIEINEKDEELLQIESFISELEGEMSELEEKNKNLNQMISEKNLEVNDLDSKLVKTQELYIKTKTLLEKFAYIKDENNILRDTISKKDLKIQDLEKLNSTLSRENKKIKNNIEELTNEVENTKTHFNILKENNKSKDLRNQLLQENLKIAEENYLLIERKLEQQEK